jgi:ribulose-phosphate 3-epimerase
LEQNPQDALTKINLMAGVASKVQLDIADGELVSGKTFQDLSFLAGLPQTNPIQIQLHLMVQKPEALLMFLPPAVKEVCIQAEAFMYKPLCMEAFDDVLKAKGIRAGLSFKHSTAFDDFTECINHCDFVQFMTVDPGAQGRPFIMESLDKIARFKEKFPDKLLQVDGGISQDTLPMVIEAGADDLIVGSAIFKSQDPVQSYKNFVLQFDHGRANYLTSRQRHSFGGEKNLQD